MISDTGVPRTLLTATLLLGLTACVLPVNLPEPGSPTLVGILRRRDGTPAIGARVAITNDYSRSGCMHPSVRGFADSAGVFRFAPTTYVQHWLVVFPPLEKFANLYAVCAGPSDSTLDRAYEGGVSLGYKEQPAHDTLQCLEWEWEGRSRTTCTGPNADDRIQARGAWRDSRGSGFYRLITVRDRTDDKRLGVYVQWVQRTDSGAPELVRETIALPLARRVWKIDSTALYSTSAGACAEVSSRGWKEHWYNLSTNDAHHFILLGAPGETRAIGSCP
jgi:hypothetical protein